MSILHDTLKIRYVQEGYLPDYPYHLVSEEEMIDAFVFNKSNYFADNYPLPCSELETEYNELKSHIQHHCIQYKKDNSYTLPDWVYSYMLGIVIGPESNQKDVHDLLVLLNLDNLYDEFTLPIYRSIFDVSGKALKYSQIRDNFNDNYRPPTMFGEPHIVKYLRLEQVRVK